MTKPNSSETAARAVDPPMDDIERIKALWRAHGTHLLTGLVIAAVAASGIRLYRFRRAGREASAHSQLASARTLNDLEALVADHGATSAAPLALLQAAKIYFDNDQFDLARQRYEQFVRDYAGHAMAPAARLGTIMCTEAEGDPASAAQAFQAFAGQYPGHYLTPQARIGYARCLEQLGRFDDARIAYEDFIAAEGDSAWATFTADALNTLDRRRDQAERRRPGAVSVIPGEPAAPPVLLLPPLEIDPAPPADNAQAD